MRQGVRGPGQPAGTGRGAAGGQLRARAGAGAQRVRRQRLHRLAPLPRQRRPGAPYPTLPKTAQCRIVVLTACFQKLHCMM